MSKSPPNDSIGNKIHNILELIHDRNVKLKRFTFREIYSDHLLLDGN